MGGQPSLRVNNGADALLPCGIEIHTIDSRENIDCHGLAPKADKFAWIRQIFDAYTVERCAVSSQCRVRCLRVCGICLNEHVQVLSRPWLGVQ